MGFFFFKRRNQNQEIIFSLEKVLRKLFTFKRIKLELYLKPYTRFNLRQIQNLQIKTKAIKLLEENTGGNTLNLSRYFSDIPKAYVIKNKLDFIHFLSRNSNNTTQKWSKDLYRHFSKGIHK